MAIATAEATKPERSEEETERLLSDPRLRELQYKLLNGGGKFKLEVTNEKPQEVQSAVAETLLMLPTAASVKPALPRCGRCATSWCLPTHRRRSR